MTTQSFKEKNSTAQESILHATNFRNQTLRNFLLLLLKSTGCESDYSLCWKSQKSFAEDLGLKVSKDQRNRTIGRMINALVREGAINCHLMTIGEATLFFGEKMNWSICSYRCDHQKNFLQILWDHPVWSGDLSSVVVDYDNSRKSVTRTDLQDPLTGRFIRGNTRDVDDTSAGFDCDEEQQQDKNTRDVNDPQKNSFIKKRRGDVVQKSRNPLIRDRVASLREPPRPRILNFDSLRPQFPEEEINLSESNDEDLLEDLGFASEPSPTANAVRAFDQEIFPSEAKPGNSLTAEEIEFLEESENLLLENQSFSIAREGQERDLPCPQDSLGGSESSEPKEALPDQRKSSLQFLEWKKKQTSRPTPAPTQYSSNSDWFRQTQIDLERGES